MELQTHGVLIEVLGVGVLLVGPNGIAQSECALGSRGVGIAW